MCLSFEDVVIFDFMNNLVVESSSQVLCVEKIMFATISLC